MRAKTWLAVAVFSLLVGFMPASAYASPHGRGGGSDRDDGGEMHEGFRGGGFHSGGAYLGPNYGPGWDFGWGWNDPWIWGPTYYPGYNAVRARHGKYGTLEFNVKPKNTRVYVDKKFIGTVKELDDQKAYVAVGNHEILLKAPDGQTMERNVYVAAGKKIKIKDRL